MPIERKIKCVKMKSNGNRRKRVLNRTHTAHSLFFHFTRRRSVSCALLLLLFVRVAVVHLFSQLPFGNLNIIFFVLCFFFCSLSLAFSFALHLGSFDAHKRNPIFEFMWASVFFLLMRAFNRIKSFTLKQEVDSFAGVFSPFSITFFLLFFEHVCIPTTIC